MAGLEWAKPSSHITSMRDSETCPNIKTVFSGGKIRIACKQSAKATSLDRMRKEEDMASL